MKIASVYNQYESGLSLSEISKKEHISRHTLKRRFSESGFFIRKQADQTSLSKLDLRYWENTVDGWKPKESENLFYLLGILKGDGSVSIQPTKNGCNHYKIELTSTDKCFVEAFISSLKSIGISHSGWIFTEKKKNEKWNDAFKTRAYCKIFVEWYKKTPLEWIQKNAIEDKFKFAFIQGMYESEGSLLNNNGCYAIEIINSNEKTLSMIKQFLEELGFHPTIRKAKRKKREKDKSDIYKIGMYRDREVKELIKNIKPCILRKVAI